jgi:hypothetical protein
MKVTNDSAKSTRQPINLANLYVNIAKPPCREMDALALEKNPLTLVASSERALVSSSVLVGGRKRDQTFLTGLESIIKCSMRITAEAAATYAGIMSVLYHTLRKVLERSTIMRIALAQPVTLTRYDGLSGGS